MRCQPLHLNRATTQPVGKLNIASCPQGIIKADRKLQCCLVADLVTNPNHILNVLGDRLRLHLRVTPIQHHTLNLVRK